MDRSGANRTFLEFPLIFPFCMRLYWWGGNWQSRGRRYRCWRRVRSYFGGPLSDVVGCDSKGVTFEEAIGRAVLISETDTVLNTTSPTEVYCIAIRQFFWRTTLWIFLPYKKYFQTEVFTTPKAPHDFLWRSLRHIFLIKNDENSPFIEVSWKFFQNFKSIQLYVQ